MLSDHRRQSRAAGLALVAALAVLACPAGAQDCPGDLDGDGNVTINEIITIVNATLNECMGACPGDVNGDGVVTIDEVIKAVNAALLGCDPTPTGCPHDFQDDTLTLGVSCAYSGPFSENLTCPTTLTALFLSNGELVAVTLGSDPLITLGGIPTSATAAMIVAYFIGDDLTPQPLSGTMQLADDGGSLILDPDTVPDFNIGGTECGFDRYHGSFTHVVRDAANLQARP